MDVTLESKGEAQIYRQGSIRVKTSEVIIHLMDIFKCIFEKITPDLKEFCKIIPFGNSITKKNNKKESDFLRFGLKCGDSSITAIQETFSIAQKANLDFKINI